MHPSISSDLGESRSERMLFDESFASLAKPGGPVVRPSIPFGWCQRREDFDERAVHVVRVLIPVERER